MNAQNIKNTKKSKLSYYRVLYFMNIAVGILAIVLFSKGIPLLKYSTNMYSEVSYEGDYLLWHLPDDMERYILNTTLCIFIFALVTIIISIVFYFKKEKKLQHLFLMLATGLNIIAGLYYFLMNLFWAKHIYSGSRKVLIFYGILLVVGIAALIWGIFFHKIKEEIHIKKRIPIILFAILTALTCLCIVYPFIALREEKKEIDIILQARISQDKTFDEEIGYQIGNYIEGEAIYVNDKLYFTVSTEDINEIRFIDKSGNMEVFWVASDEISSIDNNIYCYEEYLYILVNTSGSVRYDKVLRISTANHKEETLLESKDKFSHLGIRNNLLLVATYDEESKVNSIYNEKDEVTLYSIYAYDLTIPVTEDNGYLYDYGITKLGFNHSFWVNRILYGNYYRHNYNNEGDIMSIENVSYDRISSYDFTLCRTSPEYGTNIIETRTRSFNIFNNKIYYIKDGSRNYKVYACDPSGENRVLIGYIPNDTLAQCRIMALTEDFVLMQGDNPETDEKTAYLMWLDDGSYEKLW